MMMLTQNDVAELLKVTRRTVLNIRHRDPSFPSPVKLGKRNSLRWLRAEIDEWLLTCKR
jgi:predicted DNA-binding transcriptional regulator AlpA